MIRLPSELTGQGGAQTPSGNSGGSIRLPSDLTGGNTPQPVKKPILPLAKNSAGFAQTYKGGQGYGPSNIEDTTGKPLLVYENPQAQQTQLLANRTATKFDPTVPQKIDPATLSNSDKRMASDTIRQSLGATAKQQLDHIMPLELGGANSDALGNVNLRLEPTTKGVNTATDPIENAITQKVLNGEISLVQGWQEMAKAKGITLQEQGGKLTSPQPNPPTFMQRLTAGAKAVAGDIGNYFFGPKPKPQQTPIPQQDPMIRLGQEFTGMPTPTIPTSLPSVSEMVNKAVPAGTIMQKPELTPEQQAQKTQIEGMTPTQEWQATGKLAASIPQGIAQAALKFGVSAYQAPQTIISGGKIVPDAIPVPPMIQKILGENEISSYQRDTANDIQNGANPITAVGVNSAKALFDAWIVNDIAGAALKPALKSIANQLPESVLYKISEERIPVSDIIDVLRGTGEPSQKAIDFVNSLADEEYRPLAELALKSKKAGIPEIKIRKTGEPTLTGELLGVEKKPLQEVIETPSRALPGTQEVRPGPAVGLSTKEVRPVGGAENADLIAEAKKYPTADEFVKAQGKPVYHGSPYANKIEGEGFKLGKNENLVNAFGRGTYLSTSERSASAYAGLPEKGGGIVKAYLPKDIKLKTVSDSQAYAIDAQKLIKQGYDGVILDTGISKHITIFDPSIIKTKSQLTDIWNKANSKQSLPVEAEKIQETVPGMDEEAAKILRGTKGMTAEDIMKTYPNIQLKREVVATDVHGDKVAIPEGEKFEKVPVSREEGSPLTEEEALIKKTVSKNDFMKIVERFYPRVADFYEDEGIRSAKDYITKVDPRTIALDLDSDYNTMKAIERLVGPTEEGISTEKIIEMMKEGELREDLGTNKSFTPELSGISNAPVPEERKFYEPSGQTIPEGISYIFDSAMEKMIGSAVKKEQIFKDHKTIFHLWATNPDAAKILGISPAELNRKMRSMAGFPAQGKKIQSEINSGVPEQFQWNGITNASYFEKSGVSRKDIDSVVNDIDGAKKNGFYGPDGEMLRRGIMNSFMAIDTRMRYDDLNFNIRTLDTALGQYDNSKILITIDSGYDDTIAHEIGHYLDYRFARELGIGSSPLSDASIGWEYVQQKYDISEDHVAWAKQFKKFIDSIEMRSEIGATAQRAEYLQKRTEIFARFISRFVAWTNKQAGIRNIENNFYADIFYEKDFRNFIKLMQKKSELDAIYGIKPVSSIDISGTTNLDAIQSEEEYKTGAAKILPPKEYDEARAMGIEGSQAAEDKFAKDQRAVRAQNLPLLPTKRPSFWTKIKEGLAPMKYQEGPVRDAWLERTKYILVGNEKANKAFRELESLPKGFSSMIRYQR
ncbi:MAG: hypothetical protein JRZ94_04820, partial [Nitrososphaerota archaeon]|nr:hypothetical protein [Nitrososphaerota archaeon]